jgi:uncharacterized damage-inducible protein DinB
MVSADDLRTRISSGQVALRAAIAGASAVWENAPEDGSEGEESWSPRQVAEHVIGAEAYFAGAIAGVIDQSGPESAELSLASTDEALAALDSAVVAADQVYAAVADDDLAKELGSGTVESLLEIHAGHELDHAQQIAAAS